MKIGRLAALWLGIFQLGVAGADLTVEQVIDLTRQGIGKERILLQIEAEPRSFALSPQEIIRMREAGVDPDVIVAMIEHKPAPAPAPAPERAEAPPPPVERERVERVGELLRIENRSQEPLFVTRTEGRLALSARSGDHRLSARHYYLLDVDAGSASLVLTDSGESRTIRFLAGTHTRIHYYGPRTYLVAEGLDLGEADRTIRGLAPGASLRGLTSTGFAERIVVANEEGVEEYSGDWVAFSSRAREEDRYDAFDHGCEHDGDHHVPPPTAYDRYPDFIPAYGSPYAVPRYVRPRRYYAPGDPCR